MPDYVLGTKIGGNLFHQALENPVFFFNCFVFFFFFNDTATTEIYTLSLHDALPISRPSQRRAPMHPFDWPHKVERSEEHTSELQSRENLVCRLLLEKKKKTQRGRARVTKQTRDLNRKRKRASLRLPVFILAWPPVRACTHSALLQ